MKKTKNKVSKTTEKRILTVGDERLENHREDFESCPSCDHRMDDKEWDKVAVTLVLEPRCFKSGSISIWSECPKCHSLSWVHHSMDIFEYCDFPKAWKEAVAERAKVVKLLALREWGAGLCWKCMHLESGTVDFHAWRHCKKGSGGPEKECDAFGLFANLEKILNHL